MQLSKAVRYTWPLRCFFSSSQLLSIVHLTIYGNDCIILTKLLQWLFVNLARHMVGLRVLLATRVQQVCFDKECKGVHDNLQTMLTQDSGCQLQEDFRSLSNLYKDMKMRQHAKQQQTLAILDLDSNPARFYHISKNRVRLPSGIPLATWAEYGKSLYQSMFPQHSQLFKLIATPVSACTLFLPNNLIRQAIDSLASGKAACQFGLTIKLFKAVPGHDMSIALVQFFNDIVTRACFLSHGLKLGRFLFSKAAWPE